jgi:glycosyltransferase involved in cell wall biosynthesis
MRDGKIIIARLWPTFGGNIPSVIPVICGINPDKYETIGIYLTKTSDVPNLLEQNGKKVFFVTQKSRLPIIPFSFLRLAEILKEQGVDILHCHHHKAAFYGTIAGKIAKVPVILSHVHGLGRTRNINRKLQNYFLMPHIDKILAVGGAVKDDILKTNPSVKPEKVMNIGNSIDYDYYSNSNYDRKSVREKYNIPSDAFVFAAAGRLAETKGQKYLIEAFTKIKNRIPNAKLLFAGTGQLKEELEEKAAELGCEDSVHFLGRVDNMPQFYRGIDCFVLPSLAEGLPRTLIEAMAAGVLCIASSVGGIPEILDNGRLGFLVQAENPDELADMMQKAINLPLQKKEAIIADAKEYVKKNYSYNTMIKRIEEVYDTLIKEKNRI